MFCWFQYISQFLNMNRPTYEQALELCQNVENLIISAQVLQRLYQERPQALDRFNRFHRPANRPQVQAILDRAVPEPRPEFLVEDFININRRDQSFSYLFYQIDIIKWRTLPALNFFAQNSPSGARVLFSIQRFRANLTDHVELLAKVQFYITITNSLATLFN